MIKIIAGNKGSGKTKRLIDMTNDTAKTAAGNIVFFSSHIIDVVERICGALLSQSRGSMAAALSGRSSRAST